MLDMNPVRAGWLFRHPLPLDVLQPQGGLLENVTATRCLLAAQMLLCRQPVFNHGMSFLLLGR